MVSFIPNDQFHQELVYLKSWALRKLNRHDEAIKLINNTFRETSQIKDTRLIQSRALCYKNKYYKEADIESSANLQKYLKRALKDYLCCEQEFFATLSNRPDNFLLRQTLLAVSNSITDTYTKLYFLDKRKYVSDITKARNRIIRLKSELQKAGLTYEKFPVYSHTEIDLEYCEALIALEKNNFTLANLKINEAKKRLNLIEKNQQLKDYEPLERTKKNLRKLSIAIYNQSNRKED